MPADQQLHALLGIVLHIKPTDGRPRALTFTFAGQLGCG